MDRETLSHYSWIAVMILVLSVMMAITTPLGQYIGRGVDNVAQSIKQLSDKKSAEDTINSLSGEYEDKLNEELPHSPPSSDSTHNSVVVYGAVYKSADGTVYNAKEELPPIQDGDQYIFGDYIYEFRNSLGGWKVDTTTTKRSTYGKVLNEINSIPIVSLEKTFLGCSKLTALSDDFVIPQTVKSVKWMFSGCNELQSIPDSLVIPENADVTGLFRYCYKLSSLPSTFNLPKGSTNMNQLFLQCNTLRSLPSKFTIPATAVNVSEMFSGCTSLSSLPSTLKIPNGVTDATKMFYGCTALKTLPATFTMSNTVKTMTSMFRDCAIQAIPTTFKMSTTATNASYMFTNSNIKAIPSTFVIPSTLQSAESMFEGCRSLTSIASSFKIPGSVKDASYMFYQTGIKTIPVGILNEGTTIIDGIFSETALNSISNFTIPTTVTSAEFLFSNCESLTIIPSTFKIPGNVKNASSMFSGTGITTIQNGFIIENGVEDISYLFSEAKITSIPSSFVLPNSIKYIDYLFYNCSQLQSLHDNFTFANTSATVYPNVFSKCINLVNIPDNFALNNNTTSILYIFDGCLKLQKIPVNFKIPSSVLVTTGAFRDCKSLSGKIIIDANPSSCDIMFAGTTAPIVVKGSSTQLNKIIATSNRKNIIKYTEPANSDVLVKIFLGYDIYTGTSTYKKTSDYYLANSALTKIEFQIPTTGSLTLPNAVTTYNLYKDIDYEFCYWMVNGRQISNTVTAAQLIELNGGDRNIVIYPYFAKS